MPRGTKVIGVIPARFASQRLPGKPLVDLFGKPLVQRVYEQAKKATLLDRVIVATDDDRIMQAVQAFGGEAVMTPANVMSGSDRVAAVAKTIDGEIFVNIQGDEPLIAPEMIDQGVRLLLEDASVLVGTLAKKIETAEEITNPNVVKVVMKRNGYALYFSRSPIPYQQDGGEYQRWIESGIYYKHIGLYIFRKSFLEKYAVMKESPLERVEKLEQLRIIENGYRIKVGETVFDSIPVDTKEDVEKVVAILKSQTR